MKKIIVFLGLPGAGKGTQAKLYSNKYFLAHISTGDMLRAAVHSGSELGARVKKVIESGQLVSDELIIELISERIERSDCEKGFILDGFPRTIPQAESFSRILTEGGPSCAVYFELPEEEVLKRMSQRASKEGRVDDSKNTQFERIRVYKDQTEPLVQYYKSKGKLLIVNALGDVDQVTSRLENAISNLSS